MQRDYATRWKITFFFSPLLVWAEVSRGKKVRKYYISRRTAERICSLLDPYFDDFKLVSNISIYYYSGYDFSSSLSRLWKEKKRFSVFWAENEWRFV